MRRNVRALVLAAGRGERLRPLTSEIPKPLLPVAGRPLATWTLERLAAVGVESAALNLHHLGASIRATLGASYGRLPLVYSEEPELLGTGGALPPLRQYFAGAGAILLINGDSLCRWPLRALLERHQRGDVMATLLVHRRIDPGRFGGGVAVADGRVVAFRQSSLAWQAARTRRVFAGAAVLAAGLIERLADGPADIVSALYEPLLAEGERIAVVATARPWFDLGTPERYLEGALAWAAAGQPAGANFTAAAAAVAANARVRSSVVETGAAIGERARVVRSLVLPGARVGAGARIESSIVGPGVEVAGDSRIERSLITRDAAPKALLG